jgi:type I restriction-modification system DNA methylase subunit
MSNKETAYKKISELVERFDEQYTSYKKSEYNETLTRRDFIDPFFKALGWDIDNEQGYAEAYREVIHEDKIKIGGATKAPDYSFRIGGGKRLFFVEAKKPSVVVKDDILPAYQVRRYGWSAKLSISIITDFEEFAIYDCTKKPIPTDKASVARVKYITFRDYLKEFDFIWDTFSKERVLQGSFDKFILSTANKKGTATVDKEFLQSLDSWRTYLATSISWNNKNLDEDEINFVVQQTIDRIIFLRISEDRSIEPYGNLKNAIKQGDFYQNLFSIFREADDKYNSGLFDFKKDKISKSLSIDNKVLKTIINELYYPDSPYEFSVLSVEILGSAYEQFLGKVIRIDKAHRAHIEEKPEVRKAGGVYYTPQYVVEYIVKNTVGKLTENKTPKEISKIKIVDPACGSGSFLIGAYQYLLDWHKNYYSDNGKPSKGKKDNPLTPEGNLTTGEKKRILLNNIFGVDIDVNAVEVTKLSLLLKCMEGETPASISHQLKMFNERVLPTLDKNIKSGNSLVQNSYLENVLDFGEVDFRKVKPFEWQEEFIDVFNQGGFDAVIGNPPYSAKQSSDNKYLASFYKTVEYKCDLFAFFIERGLHILKENGHLGFIIPVSWMTNLYFKKLREHLIISKSLSEINLIDGLVFDSANIDTNIITLIKNGVNNKKVNWINSTAGKLNTVSVHRDYSQFSKEEGYSISAESDSDWYKLKKKIDKSSVELGTISKISLGMKLRSNDEFVVKEKSKTNPDIIVFGKDVGKYQPINQAHFFNFSKAVIVGGTKNPKIQQAKTKIFIQAIRNLSLEERIVATLDKNSSYFVGTVNSVILNDNTYDYEYILGLINSKLLNTYFKKRFTTISLTASFLGVLPICTLSTSSQKQKAKEISKLVEQLLSLNAEKVNTKLQTKISQIESRAIYCMNKIDQIVYELFELTAAEIKIIETK